MVAYVVGRIHVQDAERYKANYVPLSSVAVAKYGGRFLARGGRTVTLEGEDETRRMAIIEFPSVDQAEAWYASAEYERARQARAGTADARLVIVEGVAPG